MDYKIKDRYQIIDQKRMALNLVGIPVDYKTTKLIHEVLKDLDRLGGDFSIKDAAKIQVRCEEDYERYIQDVNKDKDYEVTAIHEPLSDEAQSIINKIHYKTAKAFVDKDGYVEVQGFGKIHINNWEINNETTNQKRNEQD